MGLWNPEAFKPTSDYANIQKLRGLIVAIEDGQYPEDSKFGAGKYFQVSLEDVEVLEMKGGADAPTFNDGKYSFRVNQSERENTMNYAFVMEASKLGVPLPDGLVGKIAVFERIVARPAKGKSEAITVLAPVALEGGINETTPEQEVEKLLASTTDLKAFKRAALLNPIISKSKMLTAINDGSIYKTFGYEVDEATGTLKEV